MDARTVAGKSLFFILICAFVTAFSRVFGPENNLVGVIILVLALTMLSRDLSVRPVWNLGVMTACVLAMGLFSVMDASMPTWVLILGLALLGTMWGVAGGPVGGRLIDNVPADQRGSGSALLSFFIYFGSALGTALFSGLFGFGSASAGQPIAGLDPAVFMDGFSFAMAFGVALAVIGLITAVAVNERRSA